MTLQGLEEVGDVALVVGNALDALEVRYLVGGSVASSLLGEPRSTNDIDFLVELPVGKVAALAAKLGPDFAIDEEALRDAAQTRTSWNIFYLPLVTKIDLFLKTADAFDESSLQRRRFVPLGDDGSGLYVASPEDVVLKKLAWYRAGGEVSTTQWRDVLGVLAVSGAELDHEYMVTWAAKLGVSDLLERALSDR
jgi:hypothetical protein